MLSFGTFHTLAQPQQEVYLRHHGRHLATRLEGGIRQQLYDLWGFWVETWHWTDDDRIGLLRSFSNPAELDAWLEGITGWAGDDLI